MKQKDFEDFKLRLELSLDLDYELKQLGQFIALLTQMNATDHLRSLRSSLSDLVFDSMSAFKSELPEEDKK